MLKDRLQQVLDRAHGQHEYRYDRDQYGQREYWTASLIGDCEDFALWCRDALAQQGVAADLVLCGVDNPAGDHLVVHVDGLILDNRHRWVMRQDDLPYAWIKIGKPDGTWYMIED